MVSHIIFKCLYSSYERQIRVELKIRNNKKKQFFFVHKRTLLVKRFGHLLKAWEVWWKTLATWGFRLKLRNGDLKDMGDINRTCFCLCADGTLFVTRSHGLHNS